MRLLWSYSRKGRVPQNRECMGNNCSRYKAVSPFLSPSRQRQSTERNSKQCRQPRKISHRTPCFLHPPAPWARYVACFTLALWRPHGTRRNVTANCLQSSFLNSTAKEWISQKYQSSHEDKIPLSALTLLIEWNEWHLACIDRLQSWRVLFWGSWPKLE